LPEVDSDAPVLLPLWPLPSVGLDLGRPPLAAVADGLGLLAAEALGEAEALADGIAVALADGIGVTLAVAIGDALIPGEALAVVVEEETFAPVVVAL
jgi:hypothetical protein